MSNTEQKVFLNRFVIKQLSTIDKTVYTYSFRFTNPPEPGEEYSAVNRITWAIKTPGVKFGSKIITKNAISEQYLSNPDWQLTSQGIQLLDTSKSGERLALEKLERRWLGMRLRTVGGKYKVENRKEGGYTWWNAEKIIKKDDGWEVHKGVSLDVAIDDLQSNDLFIEIDIHHHFFSPCALEDWLKKYPDYSIKWVGNTYDSQKWQLKEITKEKPNQVMLNGLGISLAQYHIQKGATEKEIREARTVYVDKGNRRRSAHLSTRLRPVMTMEMMSHSAEKGSQQAKEVFPEIRKSPQERFAQAKKTAQWVARNIYQHNDSSPKFDTKVGIVLRSKSPSLIAKSGIRISRNRDIFEHGCLRTGETQFGCLDLASNGKWSEHIEYQLRGLANKSNVELNLEQAKKKSDLPDSLFPRQEFWQNWADQGTNTVLVITPWLENSEKAKLRREALQANICLQFMRPMPTLDKYRAYNIILGLLLKAKWQPVGLKQLEDPEAADIIIGFDAGANGNLHYGTSAFAVLGDGQSLGWELPDAQPGETLDEQAVLRTVTNLISRFKKIKSRLPKKILLLRDGFIQSREFETVVGELEKSKIAVDLVEVIKSGVGRMAVFPYQSEYFEDPQPGTAIISDHDHTFKIVTSKALAGGSARPLKAIKVRGNTSLELLARQIDRLAMLNPASAYAYSRLPYVIHFADRMAKEVQRLGDISCLHQLDREKIFFA